MGFVINRKSADVIPTFSLSSQEGCFFEAECTFLLREISIKNKICAAGKRRNSSDSMSTMLRIFSI